MSAPEDHAHFRAGGVVLQSGVVFPETRLAYKTYGRLNDARDNAAVYWTSFDAHHYETEWMVAPGGATGPDRYFIIIRNLFGNGLSSSPSNSLGSSGDERSPASEIATPYRFTTGCCRARVLRMPSRTYSSFQLRDSEGEIGGLVNSAGALAIPSVHGHRAGNPAPIHVDRPSSATAVRPFLKR